MTKQLTLISLPDPDTTPAPERAASPAPGTRRARRTTPTTSTSTGRALRSAPAGPGSATPRRSPDHTGWLDRRTIETGIQGLAAARAALADATRRAHERDEEREARRVRELARQADVIRHPAARRRHAA
jgi:hypothetical protein